MTAPHPDERARLVLEAIMEGCFECEDESPEPSVASLGACHQCLCTLDRVMLALRTFDAAHPSPDPRTTA